MLDRYYRAIDAVRHTTILAYSVTGDVGSNGSLKVSFLFAIRSDNPLIPVALAQFGMYRAVAAVMSDATSYVGDYIANRLN